MPETLRAVTYIRLSSYAGEDDPTTSPQRQREATSGYCAAKGWEVVEVIEDIGVSGSDRGLRLDRPGLRRVRELLPTVDVLVFARLDRLARNVIDFRAFAEEAERHGVALVSVAESLDLTTPTGRFVATILASFAEMEAAMIADRTRAGRLRAIADGRWTGGVRPFGFRAVDNPDGPGKVLVVDDAEAELLRAGVELLWNGGSRRAVCVLFNESGIPPRRAREWSVTGVRSAMTSQTALERLYDPVERYRAVEVWRPRREPMKRGRKPSRVLSGLLRCGSCGHVLAASPSGKKREPAFVC